MHKRTRAPSHRRARKPKRTYTHAHLPQSRRYRYTPELIESGRRRYEQTDETITAIAADFGVSKSTLQRMAQRLEWVRFVAPPRDLAPAVKLAAEAEALTRTPLIPAQAGIQGPVHDAGDPGPGSPLARGRADDCARDEPPLVLPAANSTLARLHAAVLEELSAVEAMRARMKSLPQRPPDAALTARTLASLTDTLHKLQRLQCAASPTDTAYDDMPADIDEFRERLARRIRAFVASRRKPDP
ncbi:MAG: hypothetical protein WBD48_11475, partial [Pseudolabrys sp.]